MVCFPSNHKIRNVCHRGISGKEMSPSRVVQERGRGKNMVRQRSSVAFVGRDIRRKAIRGGGGGWGCYDEKNIFDFQCRTYKRHRTTVWDSECGWAHVVSTWPRTVTPPSPLECRRTHAPTTRRTFAPCEPPLPRGSFSYKSPTTFRTLRFKGVTSYSRVLTVRRYPPFAVVVVVVARSTIP